MKLELKNHSLQNNIKEILNYDEFKMNSGMLHTKHTLEIKDTHYIYDNEDDRDEDAQIIAALRLINDIYKNTEDDLDV